jgi:hypothetical protein
MALSFCQSASDRQNRPILQHLPAYTGRSYQTPAAPPPALVARRTKPTRLLPARRPSMHTVRCFSDTASDHVPVAWTVEPEPARNPLRVHGLVCSSLDRRAVAIFPFRLLRHYFHLPYLTLTSCVYKNTGSFVCVLRLFRYPVLTGNESRRSFAQKSSLQSSWIGVIPSLADAMAPFTLSNE